MNCKNTNLVPWGRGCKNTKVIYKCSSSFMLVWDVDSHKKKVMWPNLHILCQPKHGSKCRRVDFLVQMVFTAHWRIFSIHYSRKKSKKETRVPIILTKPSSGSRGAPPLFLYQTEDRRAEKIAFENEPPSLISGSGWPPPAPTFPYLKVWIHHWHPSLPRSRF